MKRCPVALRSAGGVSESGEEFADTPPEPTSKIITKSDTASWLVCHFISATVQPSRRYDRWNRIALVGFGNLPGGRWASSAIYRDKGAIKCWLRGGFVRGFSAQAFGKVKRNWLPLPSSLVAHTRPPSMLISDLQIVNPNPEPPCSFPSPMCA